jgi:Mannosyltransferase (PIG-V)
VETVPERLDPRAEPIEVTDLDVLGASSAVADDPVIGGDGTLAGRRPIPTARTRSRRRDRVIAGAGQEILWVGVIYLATRVLLLLAAFLLSRFGHHNFLHELANWDGLWYRELANHGYPNYPSHLQTTLGFFPLFSIGIWTLEPVFSVTTGHNAIWSATVAGVVISMVGGFVATWMLYRLASGWWDKAAARRATILFVLFPGSVVFSMVYSEGIMMPLAIGCIYALERRRWITAGLLAGFATAVQPVALVLILVCAFSAVRELRRQGWRLRDAAAILGPAGDEARPVLLAPVLSCLGAGTFAFFLWLWTGTPFANYQAQHHGWGEKTNLFAMVHLTTTLIHQISFTHLNDPTINLNLVVGLIGGFLLLGMLVLMARARRTISPEAIVWTLGVSFLALTSQYVPPNPRMLITAFPALMVVAYFVKGKWFTWLAWANGIALVGLSLLTFYGVTLRP